jgi:hypothetical protein
MPKLIITAPFHFAHAGIHVESFEPGKEPVDLTDECAEVALAEGWAKKPRGKAEPVETTAAPAAPETAAHTGAPETAAE